ncbi:MAG: flavodoxin family protein [Anaerovoracaceae bacterium]
MEQIKILGVCASPRRNKQTEVLMENVLKGCADSGAEVELVSLADMEINPCIGCITCQKGGECPIDDGISEVFKKIKEADGVLIGSPVYFCDVTAQCKMLIDRSYSQWPINGNKVGAIATVAGSIGCSGVIDTLNNFFSMQGITSAGWVALYGKTEDKIIAKKKAYELGQKMVKIAEFQKNNDNGAYDSITHVAYGTHTF